MFKSFRLTLVLSEKTGAEAGSCLAAEVICLFFALARVFFNVFDFEAFFPIFGFLPDDFELSKKTSVPLASKMSDNLGVECGLCFLELSNESNISTKSVSIVMSFFSSAAKQSE